MLGIIPAGGNGTRLQPLGSSKELLPLGWSDHREGKRLRAISEYVLERMFLAGVDRVCMVISGGKGDLPKFYAQTGFNNRLVYMVQPRALGLCDAVFRAGPLVRADEPVLIGLPDTVWYPRDLYQRAGVDGVHLITFPVAHPEQFDAVIGDAAGRVREVQVKQAGDPGRRIWGGITLAGEAFLRLESLWRERGASDEYLGTLLNAWLAAGEAISYDRHGTHYWDAGSPQGYAQALEQRIWEEPTPRELAA